MDKTAGNTVLMQATVESLYGQDTNKKWHPLKSDKGTLMLFVLEAPDASRSLIVKDSATKETVLLQSLAHLDTTSVSSQMGLESVIWDNKDEKKPQWTTFSVYFDPINKRASMQLEAILLGKPLSKRLFPNGTYPPIAPTSTLEASQGIPNRIADTFLLLCFAPILLVLTTASTYYTHPKSPSSKHTTRSRLSDPLRGHA